MRCQTRHTHTHACKSPNAATDWSQSLYIHMNRWKSEVLTEKQGQVGSLWHLLSNTTRAWQIHWCLNRPALLSDRSKQVNGLTRKSETGSHQTHSSASARKVVCVVSLGLWCFWYLAKKLKHSGSQQLVFNHSNRRVESKDNPAISLCLNL